jgi:NitT/TauT family transport system substrate-binding protein
MFCAAQLATVAPAAAQDLPKVTIAISGWTGFAPLVLAAQAGLFKKNGVDVTIKKISQKDRLAALASGDVQGVATTVDTQLVWATTVPLSQVLVLDNSNGGDGIGARKAVTSIKDLKGKTIAVDGRGTTPYFFLSYILQKNGISMKDVKTATLEAQPAAQAFVAGQYDAAVTYEPYISQIRDMKDGSHVLASSVDYPVIIDTLAFEPDWIAKNKKAVQGVVNGWFDALEMIKTDQKKAYEIMGADVKQTADQFAQSAKYIKYIDKAENQKQMTEQLPDLLKTAMQIQLEAGVIKKEPNLNELVDAEYVK